MDDLHCGIYDRRSAQGDIEKRKTMQDLVVRAQKVVVEVAAKFQLPLAAGKEESIALKGGCGREERRGEIVEKVKWLRVILDNCLISRSIGDTGYGRHAPYWVPLGGLVTRNGE